jgi:hypothetical protein
MTNAAVEQSIPSRSLSRYSSFSERVMNDSYRQRR